MTGTSSLTPSQPPAARYDPATDPATHLGSAAAPRGGRRRAVGIAWAVLALMIWASWFPLTRLMLIGALDPLDVTMLRVGGGALVLLPLFLPGARAIPARAWRGAALLAVCWGAPFVLVLALGVQLTSAARGATLTPTTMPVFAGLFAWAATRERPSRARLVGYALIVAAAGTLALVDPRAGEARTLLGEGFLLLAAAGWAAYTLRLRGTGLSSVQAAALVCLYSALAVLPIWLAHGLDHLRRVPAADLAVQGVYQGVFVGGISVYAFNRAVAVLGATAAATVASLVPVVATLIAVPVLGEVPTPLGALAVAVIAAGVYLAARAEPDAAPRSAPALPPVLPSPPALERKA